MRLDPPALYLTKIDQIYPCPTFLSTDSRFYQGVDTRNMLTMELSNIDRVSRMLRSNLGVTVDVGQLSISVSLPPDFTLSGMPPPEKKTHQLNMSISIIE